MFRKVNNLYIYVQNKVIMLIKILLTC